MNNVGGAYCPVPRIDGDEGPMVELYVEPTVIDYATDDEVKLARDRHCAGSDNEIEIDKPARASRGDDGMWVQAWVWIPYPEGDDDE